MADEVLLTFVVLRAVAHETSQSWLELRMRRALFSCICTVVRCSQDKENHFNALVWSDALHTDSTHPDKTSVLALVLDMSKEHTFEVSTPFFSSSPLHPPRPPSSSRKRGVRDQGRRLPRTASAMLSQSSLGFGGDSMAGFGAWNSDNARAAPDGSSQAEDARDSYSSQAAMIEPNEAERAGNVEGTQGDDDASQSEGEGIRPSQAFGRMGGGGGSEGGASENNGSGGKGSEEEEELVLEMSHVNREPCMRSLLLVIEKQRQLFEENWLDDADKSSGV